MEAGKHLIAYGCLDGNDTELADAEQAYIQADLVGKDTWVSLPEEAWPDDWWIVEHGAPKPKYDKPIVLLKKGALWASGRGLLLGASLEQTVAEGRV